MNISHNYLICVIQWMNSQIKAYITFKASTDVAFLQWTLLVNHRMVKNYCNNNAKKVKTRK